MSLWCLLDTSDSARWSVSSSSRHCRGKTTTKGATSRIKAAQGRMQAAGLRAPHAVAYLGFAALEPRFVVPLQMRRLLLQRLVFDSVCSMQRLLLCLLLRLRRLFRFLQAALSVRGGHVRSATGDSDQNSLEE